MRLVPTQTPQEASRINLALKELRLPIVGLVKRPALVQSGDCYFVQVESAEPMEIMNWKKEVLTALDRASATGFSCQVLGAW